MARDDGQMGSLSVQGTSYLRYSDFHGQGATSDTFFMAEGRSIVAAELGKN